MLIGGVLVIFGMYIYFTIKTKIEDNKALKLINEEKAKEQWITGSDGEQWGLIWAYKLPYPYKKN